ncbi:MAG: hypothetical protein K2X87_19285 [Gemmataceae bacterium]|nr:hypothetical protein [Gemmataceae bacterium]
MDEKHTQNPFAGAEVISTYTQKQATEDGWLIDVTEHAKAHRFRYPVAFTAPCYAELIAGYSRWQVRPEAERLHHVLDILAETARISPPPKDRIRLCLGTRDAEGVAYIVEFLAVCGPGDDAEPVITVMLPEDE